MRYVGSPATTTAGQNRRVYSTVEGNATNGQTVFDVTYEQGRVDAFLGGVRLVPDRDFTRTSNGIGTSITLVTGITTGDYLELVGHLGTANNAVSTFNYVVGTSSGSYAGSTTVFPVTHNSGDKVNFYLNGVLLDSTDYSISPSTGEVTLGSAAATGDYVEVQVIGALVSSSDATFAGITAGTADINGGTIDGADITVGSGKTLNVSNGTLTLADNQISGDKIHDGTISNFRSTGIDDNLTSGGPAITIDSTGKVGIGTTSPSTQLEVSQSVTTSTTTLRISNAGATGVGGARLSFGNNPNVEIGYIKNNYKDYGGGIAWTMTLAAQNQFRFVTDVLGTPTERLRIDSSGHVRANTFKNLAGTGAPDFPNGLTLAGNTTGGNITGVTLDDYEEGTFTPVYRGSTTAGTYTYSYQKGWYTKIGNIVHVIIGLYDINPSPDPSGEGVGNVEIAGLPFTSASDTVRTNIGGVFLSRWTLTGETYCSLLSNNKDYVQVFRPTTGASGTGAYLALTDRTGGSSDIGISITYQVS